MLTHRIVENYVKVVISMKISTNLEQPQLCSSIYLKLMLKECRLMGVGCYSSEATGWVLKRAVKDCEAAGRALVANFRLTRGFNGLT